MDETKAVLTHFLMDVFHILLKNEEKYMKQEGYTNLSLKELHVIEAVRQAERSGQSNQAANIAGSLHITAGTLTATVRLLEKKGYLVRQRDEKDRRVVRIHTTEAGRRAGETHQQFHEGQVKNALTILEEGEMEALLHALCNLSSFFRGSRAKGGF